MAAMRVPRPDALALALAAFLGAFPPATAAQDAGRGSRLYLGLPGGEPSCVECHGPDPGLNRNRLLKAAQGPQAILQAISHAAAMGYLGELLDATARADLSAWLGQVDAAIQDDAASQVWPWGVEFGRADAQAAPQTQPVVLRNTGALGLWLAPRLRATAPGGADGLQLTHDCPTLLESGQQCTAWVTLDAARAARVQAALDWGDPGLRPVGIAAWIASGPLGSAQWREDTDGTWALDMPAGEVRSVQRILVNTGTAPLTLGVPAITGPGRTAFQVEAGGCTTGLVLGPGEACTVRLRFDARAGAAQQALLQWRNDGSHARPLRLVLRSREAAPAPQPPPPAAAPPAAANPSPSPVPSPAPPPAPAVPGAGGCSTAHPAAKPDLLMPGLVLAALMARAGRRRPRASAGPSCPALHSSMSAPVVPLPGGNS